MEMDLAKMCGTIKLEKIATVGFKGDLDIGLKHLIIDHQDDIIDVEEINEVKQSSEDEDEKMLKFEIYKIV